MEAYQTQNLALAVTLATVGVPFYAEPGQKPCPVINLYDAEIIRGMVDGKGEPIYKGLTLEAAARRAWKEGREGRISYCFQWAPILPAVIEAYNEQEEAIKTATGRGDSGAIGSPTCEIEVEPGIAARLACQLFANRKTLRDAWKYPVPMIAIYGAAKTETRDGVKVAVGSFKVMSLNATKANRERLGI